MTDFNLNGLIEELRAQAEAHFDQQLLDHHEVEENLYILGELSQQAIGLMQQEGKIDVPGMPIPIVFEQNIASQTLTLLHHGIICILDKCAELHITDEPKRHIAQMSALHIYNQSKQITASTFGQEQTPEFQISEERQIEYIRKSSANHFIHFLGEYEREHGPIDREPDVGFDDGFPPGMEITETAANAPQAMDADDWMDDFDDDFGEENDSWLDDLKTPPQHQGPLPLPMAPEPVQQIPIPKPTSLANAHKYAAVALLLNTLTPAMQERILSHFNHNEHMLINSYWQDPDRIPRETDINLVSQHLRQLKQLIEQGSQSTHSSAHRHIQHLAQAYSKADMVSCIERERPKIKQFVSGFYQDTLQEGDTPTAVELPGKVEEILYHHLQKALSYR